jgi:hypothetical protein
MKNRKILKDYFIYINTLGKKLNMPFKDTEKRNEYQRVYRAKNTDYNEKEKARMMKNNLFRNEWNRFRKILLP